VLDTQIRVGTSTGFDRAPHCHEKQRSCPGCGCGTKAEAQGLLDLDPIDAHGVFKAPLVRRMGTCWCCGCPRELFAYPLDPLSRSRSRRSRLIGICSTSQTCNRIYTMHPVPRLYQYSIILVDGELITHTHTSWMECIRRQWWRGTHYCTSRLASSPGA
jgi:hypothetical protein